MSIENEAPSSDEKVRANRYEMGSKAVNVDGKPTISYEEVDGKQLPVLEVPVTIYKRDPTGNIVGEGRFSTYRITLDPDNEFALKWSTRIDDMSKPNEISNIEKEEAEELCETRFVLQAIEQVRGEA